MASHALQVERIALAGAKRGVRSIGIRSSLIYGRGAGMFVEGPIESARREGAARYVGSGSMRMSTVHIDDLVDLLARALRDAPPDSIFNVAAEPPVTTLELARATAGAAGTSRTESVPREKALHELGFLGEVMGKNLWLSTERARQVLGWSPKEPSILDELASGSYAQA